MAAGKSTHHVQHHKVPGRIKTSLIVLGLLAAGIAAFTVVDDARRPLHAIAAPTVLSVASASTDGTIAQNKRMSTDDYLSRDVNDKISSPVSGPRECRPDQGIVNDCTFQ